MATLYSILLLVGIFVAMVVDVATSRALTWSLIPFTASVFAWIVFIPAIKFGAKGIAYSLIAITVFVIPFLLALEYVIDRLLESDTLLFSMGVRITPLAVAFIWGSYFLFTKLKTRILLAVAIVVLLSSPVSYFMNLIITSMLNQPYESLSLFLNTFVPVIVAAILFVIEIVIRRKMRLES